MLAHVVAIGAARGLLYAPAMGLFLASFDASLLPWTYVGVSVVSGLLSAVYLVLTRRIHYSRLLLGTLVVTAALTMVAWIGVGGERARLFVFALPIWFESVFILTELTVWGLASRVFDIQQGKRLFGYLSAGGQLGLAGVGLIMPIAVERLGSTNMLGLAAGALIVSLVPLLILIRSHGSTIDAEDHDEDESSADSPDASAAGVGVRGRFIAAMSAHMVLSVFAYQFVDNIFYVVAERQFTDADAMSGFVGLVTAAISVTSLLGALLLTGPILRRIGGPRSLMVRPGLVGAIGLVIVVLAPGVSSLVVLLVLVTALRFTNEVFSDALSGPAFNLLYQPLAAGPRARVHAFIDGIVTPISSGIAGLVLVLLVNVLGLRELPLTSVLLVLLLACIGADAVLRRDYPAMLSRALGSPRRDELVFRELGGESLDALVAVLEGDNSRSVCWAMTVLERADLRRLEPHLARLLTHASDEVQLAALAVVERQRVVGAEALVAALLDDQSPRVRATALGTLATISRDNALDELRARLADPDEDQAVIVEAAAGLLRCGGREGEQLVGARLDQLRESPSVADRVMLAGIIAESGLVRLHTLLLALLDDPQTEVRIAAAVAAARVHHPALVPALVACLDHRQVRSAAANALAGYGADLGPALSAALDDWRGHSRAHLQALLKVVARGRDPVTAQILERNLGHPDAEVEAEVVTALVSMRHLLAVDHPSLDHALERLANAGQHMLLARIELDGVEEAEALCSALEDELERIGLRVLRVLALGYPRAEMHKVSFNVEWGFKYHRSLALESLTLMLGPDHLALALPLVDQDRPADLRLDALHEVVSPCEPLDSGTWLIEIASGRPPWTETWLQACAIHACGRLRLEPARVTLTAASASEEPVVAKTARASLDRLRPPSEPSEDRAMLTIEKVAILKTTEVFAESPDHVLAVVASVAEEVQIPAGQTFISEGNEEDGLYVVVEGELEVESRGRLLARLGPGEVVGELQVLDPAPRAASVRTTSDSLLFRIRREPLVDVLLDRPEITLSLARVIVRRMKKTQNQ